MDGEDRPYLSLLGAGCFTYKTEVVGIVISTFSEDRKMSLKKLTTSLRPYNWYLMKSVMLPYCHLKAKPTFHLSNFLVSETNHKDQYMVRDHHRTHAQHHGGEELFWKNKISVATIFSPNCQRRVRLESSSRKTD